MLKKILAGYGSVLAALGRFLALLAVSVGAGFLVVYPLWKLADSNPSAYTVIFAILFCALAGFLAVRAIRRAIALDKRRFLRSLARKAVIVIGLASFVALVLARRVAVAFATLALTAALYGFLAFGLSRDTGR